MASRYTPPERLIVDDSKYTKAGKLTKSGARFAIINAKSKAKVAAGLTRAQAVARMREDGYEPFTSRSGLESWKKYKNGNGNRNGTSKKKRKR